MAERVEDRVTAHLRVMATARRDFDRWAHPDARIRADLTGGHLEADSADQRDVLVAYLAERQPMLDLARASLMSRLVARVGGFRSAGSRP